MPKYDAATDRFWDGDDPLPRTDEEAIKMGLSYDPATKAWWSGDVLVVRQKVIDAYEKLCGAGYVTAEDLKD